jgi:hypothetical protein
VPVIKQDRATRAGRGNRPTIGAGGDRPCSTERPIDKIRPIVRESPQSRVQSKSSPWYRCWSRRSVGRRG